jgi:hypothetical protein
MQRTIAALAVVASMALPGVVMAQNVKTGGSETLTIKGFIIATLYAQDQSFTYTNGTGAEFPSSDYKTDKWLLSGDVRNTRITMAFNGPEVADMKLGAVLEMDFYGGFNGSGAFSDEQPMPRMRLAYVDMTRGNTVFRIGQAFAPSFGYVPASPTHVAFPLGFGSAGLAGWRFPGLFVYHTFNKGVKLSLAAMRGSWNEPAGGLLNSLSAGETGTPQFEGRLDFNTGAASFYVVGHYAQLDCNGIGTSTGGGCDPNGTKKTVDNTLAEFGFKFGKGAFSLAGNVYTGNATGNLFGTTAQFGDISDWGGWIQANVKFNPNWSGHLFYGMDDPNDKDVLNSGAGNRIKNEQVAASAMYSNGPYVFGVEWMHDTITRGTLVSPDAGGGIDQSKVSGNQLSFSVWYKF